MIAALNSCRPSDATSCPATRAGGTILRRNSTRGAAAAPVTTTLSA